MATGSQFSKVWWRFVRQRTDGDVFAFFAWGKKLCWAWRVKTRHCPRRGGFTWLARAASLCKIMPLVTLGVSLHPATPKQYTRLTQASPTLWVGRGKNNLPILPCTLRCHLPLTIGGVILVSWWKIVSFSNYLSRSQLFLAFIAILVNEIFLWQTYQNQGWDKPNHALSICPF